MPINVVFSDGGCDVNYILCQVLTFLMTAMLVSLAEPVVRIVFQRRAFDASASKLVSSLLICCKCVGSLCELLAPVSF